jgi:hypothetical protein
MRRNFYCLFFDHLEVSWAIGSTFSKVYTGAFCWFADWAYGMLFLRAAAFGHLFTHSESCIQFVIQLYHENKHIDSTMNGYLQFLDDFSDVHVLGTYIHRD